MSVTNTPRCMIYCINKLIIELVLVKVNSS